MASYPRDVYFAADKADDTVSFLKSKANLWFSTLHQNKYLDKIRRSWASYHGAYYGFEGSDGHEITFGGEQGELANIAVNHYRNIASHMLVMVTATRPSFQPRAANMDHKTEVQTYLAHGILEY